MMVYLRYRTDTSADRIGSLPSIVTTLPKQKPQEKNKSVDLDLDIPTDSSFRLDLSREYSAFGGKRPSTFT